MGLRRTFRSLKRNRDLIVAGCIFSIAGLHIVAIVRQIGADALRWVVNDPAFNLFLLVVFPPAIALFIQSISPSIISRLRGIARWTWCAALVAMTLLAIHTVGTDARRDPLEPYLFGASTTLVPIERQARDELRTLYDEAANTTGTDRQSKFDNLEKQRRTLFSAYRAKAQEISQAGSMWSLAGILHLVLNVIAAIAVSVMVWYTALVVWVTSRVPNLRRDDIFQGLTVSFALMTLWFPARLYTEWYLHFYAFQNLSSYVVFALMVVAGIVMLLLLLVLRFPNNTAGVLTSLASVASGVVSIVGYTNPQYVWPLTRVMESMSFGQYLTLLAVLGFGAAVITSSLSRQALQPEPAVARDRG